MKATLQSLVLLVNFISFSVFGVIQNPTWEQLTKEQKELVEQAMVARKNAYAPYSNYHVGVALKTAAGQVFTGSNVENASYGLTICAERTAVFKAVSEGQANIKTLALVTRDGGMPCGACRQVINEFNPNAQIIVTDVNRRKIMVSTLKDILPEGFGPPGLK